MKPDFIIIHEVFDKSIARNLGVEQEVLLIPTAFIQAVAPQYPEESFQNQSGEEIIIPSKEEKIGAAIITLHNMRKISCAETFQQIASALGAVAVSNGNNPQVIKSNLN